LRLANHRLFCLRFLSFLIRKRQNLWGLTLTLAACQSAPTLPPPLRVSFVGDVLLARAVPMALLRDSLALSRTTQALWADSRYVIGNLECPLTDHQQPVGKPFVFRAEPHFAGWLRRLGFTHLSLANNHTLDQHAPGLHDTGRHLRAAGLGALGYSPSPATGCQPTLLGPDSTVAVFAYSALWQRLPDESCVCGRDFATFCDRLATYKTLFPARAVLVYLHWGTEYTAEPSAEQRQQARTLIDCGAAAVIGAHPHVVQSLEFYRGCPILYSLGNFLFDQRGRFTDLALQADFDLRDGRVTATYLRPLQLLGAVPRPADQPARTALATRIGQYSPNVRLTELPDAGRGWQLLPAQPARATDSLTGFFIRQVLLRDSGTQAAVRLDYLPRNQQYRVRVQANGHESMTRFGYPVYQLTQGDVDNDGHVDLLLGPLKATYLDSTVRRRLFVYRLDPATARLRPRWLGSRVAYRLRYFKPVRSGGLTYVHTVEQTPDGRYVIGRYVWQGFGLVLDRFLARRLSLDAAYQQFIESTDEPVAAAN
jgi:Bacterial capsule synthesis protein PGA_cap